MGGKGSTRWSNDYVRSLTVNDCYCLDINVCKVYLNSPHGTAGKLPIYLKAKSSFFNLLNFEELIPNTTAFRWQNNKVNALRCGNCQIVIFKY